MQTSGSGRAAKRFDCGPGNGLMVDEGSPFAGDEAGAVVVFECDFVFVCG